MIFIYLTKVNPIVITFDLFLFIAIINRKLWQILIITNIINNLLKRNNNFVVFYAF